VVPGFSNALRTWNRRFFDFSILKKKTGTGGYF
jgi:hypothetical protein